MQKKSDTKAVHDESQRPTGANNSSQRPLSSLEPLAPVQPLDPLRALEQVNSQLDQLPAAAPPAAKLPPTMSSYASPPARRKSKPSQGSSRMLLGIGLGAGVAAIIMVAGFFLLRDLDLTVGDLAPLNVADAEATDDETTESETKQSSPVIKNNNHRALMPKPVTAGGSSKKQPPAQAPAKPAPTTVASTGGSSQPKATNPPPPANAAPPKKRPAPPPMPVPQSPPSRPGVPPKPLVPTWEGLPLAVDLPSLEDKENIDKPVAMGKLKVPEDSQCQLAIVYGIEGETPKYQFKLESEPPQSRLWRVTMFAVPTPKTELPPEAEQPVEVAALELIDGDLQFRWLADCLRAPAEKLRNAVLWVLADGKKQRIQLRQCAKPMPLLLDLEEGELSIPFDVASLPPLKVLQLELLEASAVKIPAVQPSTKRVKSEELLRLQVRQGQPGVEVRLQLAVDESTAGVRVQASIVDREEVEPLTRAKVSSLQRELPGDIHKAEAELTRSKKRIADLEGDVNRLTSRFGTGSVSANSQIASLRKQIESERDSEREVNARLHRMQRLINALPDLANVRGQIDDKAQLRVRVFFVSGGEEVNLLWM